MRIVCIGQGAFGEKVLQTLVERGEEIVGVYTTPDIPGKTNPLKQIALQLGIRLFQPKQMRAPEVYDEYAKLKPDLNVMAFVTSILPDFILDYPKLGTIQYHPSLLPRHRGGSAINWAIINGETKTVYNLIRGTNPQPGARTYFRGLRLKVFDSELLATVVDGLPGEIIDNTGHGFVVAAAGGAILVKKVQPEGSPKIGADEFAKQLGLKVGDKLLAVAGI